MRTTRRVTLLLPALLGCGLLDVSGPERTTMYVHHHLAECVGVVIQSCLLVQETGAAGLGFLYQGIEGFTWEWGYVHALAIEVHDVRNPPADGSSVRYVLDRILDRQPVAANTEFAIAVTTSEGRVAQVAPGEYRVLASGRFRCATAAACEGLDAAIAAGGRIQLTLAHTGDAAAPMRLEAWRSCAPNSPPHPLGCP